MTPLSLSLWLQSRVPRDDRERGDVPGWVLITLMTAVIVAGLWTFAEGAMKDILNNALCTVTPKSGC